MNSRSIAFIAIATLLCFACNSNSNPDEDVHQLDKQLSSINAVDSINDFSADSTGSQQQITSNKKQTPSGEVPKPIDWDKKIVKTANISAEVKDYKNFSRQLTEKVRKYGGYISQEEQNESEYKIQNNIVIKVPVEQFENAVNDLTADVSKVNEKRITSDDVTTQLIDGKSRLEAKKQVRLRYLDLLKQAKNMEEILTVQNEINGIQEDIETVNGRINFLSHSSAMSTINFSYSQILNPSAIESESGQSFWTKTKSAFVNGWYWIGEIFVGLVTIWPLLLVIILGILFFRKKQMPKIKSNAS